MSECIFCGIAEGKSPCSRVYEDNLALAFMDISPVVRGHLLVVPKQHYTCLSDMDEETGAHLFRVAMRLQQGLRASGIKCDGINLFLADGEAAGQEVGHVHLHIFPRYAGDDFKIDADWSQHPARGELDALAGQIAENVKHAARSTQHD